MDTDIDEDTATARLQAMRMTGSDSGESDDSNSGRRPTRSKFPAWFFPSLGEQRRTFCINVLKRDDIPSICELGCGEGSVLRPMINAATHKDSFPDIFVDEVDLYARLNIDVAQTPPPDSDDDAANEGESPEEMVKRKMAKYINMDVLEKVKQLPQLRPQDKELHLRKIAGLDILPEVLEQAIQQTAPPPPPDESSPFSNFWPDRDRWEDLRVEIWQGSLAVYNDSFDSYDSFILTEVIEHLDDRTLRKFPEVLFGSYRPRLIVVTTPNYDFNKYFQRTEKKGADEEERHQYKDPTGRTDRVFRDSDHKFEWTEEEFDDWCREMTMKYDYSYELTGVGSLKNYFGGGGFHAMSAEASSSNAATPRQLPKHVQEYLDTCPGGDPSKIFATQCAIFRRKFLYESERSPRSPVQVPLAFYKSPSTTVKALSGVGRESPKPSSISDSSSPGQQKLLKSHFYPAVKEAGQPKSSLEIRIVLDCLMRDRMQVRSASLRELWGRHEVARVCGGYINKIIEALIQDPDKAWDLDYKPEILLNGSQVEDAVFVILKDFVEPERDWGGSDEELEDQEQGNGEPKPRINKKRGSQPKWYERDLELEDDIKGMRIEDDVDKKIEEDEWQHSQGSQNGFDEDDTWKEWGTSTQVPLGADSDRFQEIQENNAWGSDEEDSTVAKKVATQPAPPAVEGSGWD